VHAGREETARAAAQAMRQAITIGPVAPDVPPLIHERIG